MQALLLSLILTTVAADGADPAVAGAGDAGGAADRNKAGAVDTVVVCPIAFRPALRPWMEYRVAQGHRLALADTGSADEIRTAIRRHAAGGGLRYVVLVGDSEPAGAKAPGAGTTSGAGAALRARSVPTHLAKAQINVRFGSEPDIATDNWYADLDDDAVPDVAVGRLTADTPDELSRMVAKILRYERAAPTARWQRKVNFVAGVGGFGGLIDSVIETATKKFLTDGIPAAYRTTMTYGSWHSAYCPDPRRFHEIAVRRLNEGCLFWVYIGHGYPRGLDQVRTPVGGFHILDTGDAAKLKGASAPPIAVMLACYTGAFDRPRDCLAEEMLRADGGPVALLAGSRVTMPYAMAVLGNEMLDQYFHHRRETIGEVLLHAKRQMVAKKEARAGDPRQWLDLLAATLSPNSKNLAEERAEHLLLFNLLGDPLLRVAHPQPVSLATGKTARAGERIEVAGECPVDGVLTLELVCRRDCTRKPVAARDRFEASGAALAAFDQTYNEANDPSWSKRELRVSAGSFRAELEVPRGAYGPCHVCAEVVGERGYALGSADVFIRRSHPAKPAE